MATIILHVYYIHEIIRPRDDNVSDVKLLALCLEVNSGVEMGQSATTYTLNCCMQESNDSQYHHR